jgi:hypothetical protein
MKTSRLDLPIPHNHSSPCIATGSTITSRSQLVQTDCSSSRPNGHEA